MRRSKWSGAEEDNPLRTREVPAVLEQPLYEADSFPDEGLSERLHETHGLQTEEIAQVKAAAEHEGPPWWNSREVLATLRHKLSCDPWLRDLLYDRSFVPLFLGAIENASLIPRQQQATEILYQWLRFTEKRYFHTFNAARLWNELRPLLKSYRPMAQAG